MLGAPADDAECVSEYLFGETLVKVAKLSSIDRNTDTDNSKACHQDDDRWLLCVAERDGYQGFVAKEHLTLFSSHPPVSTHRVAAKSTFVFSQPSIKSTVLLRLPLLSHVVASDETNASFVKLDTGGFVWKAHLTLFDVPVGGSALHLAKSHFLGSPYLWGGCSPQGVDCSGLIQALAAAKGIQIPRDSGDQEKALAHDVPYAQRQAEDIVYWPGHTGILIDPDTLLHATAHTLSCVVEPLAAVTERAGDITSIKRLFDNCSLR